MIANDITSRQACLLFMAVLFDTAMFAALHTEALHDVLRDTLGIAAVARQVTAQHSAR